MAADHSSMLPYLFLITNKLSNRVFSDQRYSAHSTSTPISENFQLLFWQEMPGTHSDIQIPQSPSTHTYHR